MPNNFNSDSINILTIVPARGGSKGVTKKNIRIVGNRPLIEWTIESIQKSFIKDDFFVSTDNEEISKISSAMNAKIIDRPAELATDESQAIDLILHSISAAEEISNLKYDYILLLQPTSPMRTFNDINNAIEVLNNKKPDSLVSVYKVEDTHPARMYTIDRGYLNALYEEGNSTRRQDLDEVFHRNGAIYASSISSLKSTNKILGGNTIPLIMPKDRSINIDDIQDLQVADFLLKYKK